MESENDKYQFENQNLNENEVEDENSNSKSASVSEDNSIEPETPSEQSIEQESIEVAHQPQENELIQVESLHSMEHVMLDFNQFPDRSQLLPTPTQSPGPEQCVPQMNQLQNTTPQSMPPPGNDIPPQHQYAGSEHFMPPQNQYSGQFLVPQNQPFMHQPDQNLNQSIHPDGQPTTMMPLSYASNALRTEQILLADQPEQTRSCCATVCCGCFLSDNRPFETPTESRMKESQKKLGSKLKDEMPWDLLGQPDHEWHDSWLMPQYYFASFRVLLATYSVWSLMSFYDNFYTNTWTSGTERLLDPTSTMRFYIVFLALLSVTIAMVGVAIFSVFRIILSEGQYKKLVDFKVNRTELGLWRSWANFGINHHYDMAPILSTFPLVLFLIPTKLFDVSVRQSILPALTLPILVAFDWWVAKRCRFNKDYPRRWTIFMIYGMAAYGGFLTTMNMLFYRFILAIFRKESVFISFLPVILLSVCFIGITAMGNDFMTSMIKVKVEYLLSPAVGVTIRDPEERIAENEEIYKKKNDEKLMALAEKQKKMIEALGIKLPAAGAEATTATTTNEGSTEGTTAEVANTNDQSIEPPNYDPATNINGIDPIEKEIEILTSASE